MRKDERRELLAMLTRHLAAVRSVVTTYLQVFSGTNKQECSGGEKKTNKEITAIRHIAFLHENLQSSCFSLQSFRRLTIIYQQDSISYLFMYHFLSRL